MIHTTIVSPGWHLDHVEVVANTGGEYFFPCQKWFDKKEDDGLVERILEVPLSPVVQSTCEQHMKCQRRMLLEDMRRASHAFMIALPPRWPHVMPRPRSSSTR